MFKVGTRYSSLLAPGRFQVRPEQAARLETGEHQIGHHWIVDSVAKGGDIPRVLVDAAILKPSLGGIGSYVVGLVDALAQRDDFRLSVATSVPEEFGSLPGVDVLELHPATRDFARRALWRERKLRALIMATRADVLVAPVPELPIRRIPVPSVVVLHDVSQVLAPALYGWPKWVRYTVGLRLTCSAASAVVCVSNATLLGLRYTVGVEGRKCHVIGQGPQDLPSVERSGGRERPFLLYVGTMLPHKNVEVLIRALHDGDPARRDLRLLLAGPIDPAQELALTARIRELGLQERVSHVGFVTAERLARLYAEAVGVALPSFIEGFGLPVLEAMTRGVPVIASDIPALREVGGDAAIYVDRPLDPDAWRTAIARLLDDPALQAKLSEQGRNRARRFSWERVGKQFGGLLHEVVSAPSTRVPRR